MADIYDLAIQGAKRRASNQFGDISGDTFTGQLQTMQFLNNLITTKTNRDNVRDENTFSQLLKNLGSATNEVQLDNFKTLLDNASVSPNNQISLDSMNNIYINKRAAHGAGKTAYGTYDNNPEKFKLTYEQLNEMDFGFDEAGNKVNPEIGRSQVDLLLKEADDVAIQIAHLENAGQYKYGSTPNSVVLERLKRYQGQLAQVQKAWFGGLTSEEIDVILSGGDYTKVQDNKLKGIDKAYEKNRTEQTKWVGKQITFLQKIANNDAEGAGAWLEQWRGETDTSELGQAFKDNLPSADTKINTTEKGEIVMDQSLLLVQSTLEDLVKRTGLNQTALVNERKKWQKYGTEDPTGESLFESADEDDNAQFNINEQAKLEEHKRLLEVQNQVIGADKGKTKVAGTRKEKIAQWIFDNPAASDEELSGYMKSLDADKGKTKVADTTVIEDSEGTNIQTTASQSSNVGNQITQMTSEIEEIIKLGAEEGLSEKDIETSQDAMFLQEDDDGNITNILADKKEQLENLQSSIIANDEFPAYLNEPIDEEGSVDIEAIVDYIDKNRNKVVTGVGLSGAGAYSLAKTKPVLNATTKATNYLKLVGGLNETDIAQIFDDTRIQDRIRQVEVYDNEISKATGDLKKTIRSAAYNQRRKGIKEIGEILNEKGIKLKGKDVDWLAEDNFKHLNRMIKNKNKWNLFKLKASMGGISQIFKTGGDFVKVVGKAGLTVGPLEGAMLGWYAGDKLGLDASGKFTTAVAGYGTMKYITKKIMNRGGWMSALKNPVLTSKIGKYLIKKAPKTAMKLGLKGGVGLAGTFFPEAISSAVGVGMLAWTANDIRKLAKEHPEIKQMLLDYAEGRYDEDKPIITQGPKVAEKRAKREREALPGEYLSLFKSETSVPWKEYGGKKQSLSVADKSKLKDFSAGKKEEQRLLEEFKDKYNLSNKAIQILEKLSMRHRLASSGPLKKSQEDKLNRELIKELKKLGLYK